MHYNIFLFLLNLLLHPLNTENWAKIWGIELAPTCNLIRTARVRDRLQMRKLIVEAWWGVENGRKKMHWRSWEWLSSPKFLGVLGFRDLHFFNQAMLGSGMETYHWTRIFCARVLKSRYFPFTDFLPASSSRSASYTWRSLFWAIGNGKNIRSVSYTWRSLFWAIGNGKNIQTVDALVNPVTRQWDYAMVNTFFQPNCC